MSMIGKTLAHYEITTEIGKGGMGEVYQAKDQKLGRDVAIKVLPQEFAKDTDRVARFQREAKLLASLNHPNIAAIHGLEESDGIHFLVLELIEGDTLADRLKRGAVPVEEALKLALQIAEALEAAHEKGVIHRDLKPANIKVTPDGKVKVLDFGLAKAFAGEQSDLNLSNSPTLSQAATMQGVILGTAAYMSPEQARGKEVDKRTDIWAFGCVLYEMLTGKAAFQGEDVTEILAAVVKSGVDLDLLPANIHSRVCEVLSRCLLKERKKRYSGIGDVQYEIEKVLTDPSGVFAHSSVIVKPRKKLRVGISWLAAAVVLSLIIAGLAGWYLKPLEPRQVIRFSYDLAEGLEINDTAPAPNIAISNDGSLLAYATPEGIYLRRMRDWIARLLPGTEGALHPFFSPNGQWIGYISNGKLKKINVDSNSSVTLCDASVEGGFSWTSDKRILQGSGAIIYWVSEDGGKLEPLFQEKGGVLGAPQMLPDGKSVLLTKGSTSLNKIMVHSLKSGESKELPIEGSFARYIKNGHIVYGAENNLRAVPFDSDKLEVTGGPIPLVEGVLNIKWIWHYAVSDSGTLVYIPGQATASSKRTLVWVNREGIEEPISVQPDDYRGFQISPDGTQIAVSILAGGNQDIYIGDIALKNKWKLTSGTSSNAFPLWTPDTKSIVFTSNRGDGFSLYQKSVGGTGEIEVLSKQDNLVFPNFWSKDGKTLVLYNGLKVGMLDMEGDKDIKQLLPEKSSYYAIIHPDGNWIAYVSTDEGQEKVYVRSFPDVNKGGRYTMSPNGGFCPLWSKDGRELFYWTPNAVMVVEVKTTPKFEFLEHRVLFKRTPVYTSMMGVSGLVWDIHPDGNKFLMMKPFGSESDTPRPNPSKINIILNWFEELKQKVPVD